MHTAFMQAFFLTQALQQRAKMPDLMGLAIQLWHLFGLDYVLRKMNNGFASFSLSGKK
jgi:hypothetical protein